MYIHYFRCPKKPVPIAITKAEDLAILFPHDCQTIRCRVEQSIDDAKKRIAAIVSIDDNVRTYDNTVHPYDMLIGYSPLTITRDVIVILKMLSPDEHIRNTCDQEFLKISEFSLEHIENNKALYHALQAYAQGNAKKEMLTEQEQYFISQTLDELKRHGLELPDEQLKKVHELENQITLAIQQFETNIASDSKTIMVKRSDLEGLDNDFINNLKTTPEGLYLLDIDIPTQLQVLKYCSQESTRKAFYKAFMTRAYPVNEPILVDIIKKRNELAHVLGFNNYAELNLASTMAKKPVTVENFLNELVQKGTQKSDEDFARLTATLPPSVILTPDNKMQPWDFEFVKTWYENSHYNLDSKEVAQYFPLDKTIDGLINIYAQFFNLEFKKIPAKNLWYPDLILLQVSDRSSKEIINYTILDLFPRPHKYAHVIQSTIIPALYGKHISLSTIITNFTSSTKEKPSLLSLQEVIMFFHEFGHTVHAMLGKTHSPSLTGTNVKLDFAETPSQMFEQWIHNKEILKMISSHYKTGQQLPDELIDKIIALKNLSSGMELMNKILYSFVSLGFYSQAELVPQDYMRAVNNRLPLHLVFDNDNHRYTSFDHLMDYGARYYSYLWSRVIALDLFSYIKQQGLLDPEVGERLSKMILSQGGTQEPEILIKQYLGREPTQDAFLKDLGL